MVQLVNLVNASAKIFFHGYQSTQRVLHSQITFSFKFPLTYRLETVLMVHTVYENSLNKCFRANRD